MKKDKKTFAYSDNPGSFSMFFISWNALIDHWEKEFKSRYECEKWMQKQVVGVVLPNINSEEPIVYANKYGKLSADEKKALLARAV